MDPDSARELQPEGASRLQNCWSRLRARPRLFWSLAVGIPACCLCSFVVYLTVPQIIMNERIRRSVVDIEDCILVIGPNANSEISPSVRMSISKSVMQVPLISFTAHVKGFTATIWWKRKSAAYGEGQPREEDRDVEIGTMRVERGVDMDSSKDVEINIAGEVAISDPRSLSQVVSHFLQDENITFGFTSRVDVQAYVYGWIPVPFYGISVGKDMTLPAFNNFRDKMVGLREFKKVHGLPGEINVSAIGNVYNPTPVTVVMKDSCQMQIYYTWQGKEYRVGSLNIDPPLTLKPGDNTPVGWARVHPTDVSTVEAIQAFAADYIGPQHGLTPAGLRPLLIRMADGTSNSPLVRAATEFLSVDVDFRPQPVAFLLAVTCDVIAFASPVPPFYRVVVHLRAKNPIPQEVHFHQVRLEARHLNLQGPALYHYNHDLDTSKFILGPLEERTLDFELEPLHEVSWGFLFSPTELAQLLSEAAVQNVTGGLVVDLTLSINDGYMQVIPYRNEAISIQLCFRPRTPTDVCGGLPPMPP